MKPRTVAVTAATISLFLMAAASASHDAHAHSAVDRETKTKDVDQYKIAFQLYPKFASADQNATLHFSIFDKNSSNVNGVYAAMVMKEKESGRVVEQMPYRFYEFGDISMPYKFHENEDYVATLLTRIEEDPKYSAAPLQADFDVSVGQTTVLSPNEFLLMIVPFTAALTGGIIFMFKRKRK
jgi:hypothetical protein